MSKDMLAHWLKLVDKDGWVPREQILGAEAESRVPPEFIVQYPDNANPPTLYLALEGLIDRGDLTDADIKFLKGAFSALVANFKWFVKTQKGPERNTFRWRGASGVHTLPSGLDDYPRTHEERSDKEEHVDLLSWMIISSNILDKLATTVDIYDIPQFKMIEEELLNRLQERYWNEEFAAYTDYDGTEGKTVDNVGYISLFPFLFGLVSVDSPRLGQLLDLMEDPKHLKTNFGLRSLSASHRLYGKDKNYWRGPVWININYLVLRALFRYYMHDGPYATRAQIVYTTLRRNIVSNLVKVFKKQNDIFEHYSPTTGKGLGQHPFAGWTALVVLIMAEKY